MRFSLICGLLLFSLVYTVYITLTQATNALTSVCYPPGFLGIVLFVDSGRQEGSGWVFLAFPDTLSAKGSMSRPVSGALFTQHRPVTRLYTSHRSLAPLNTSNRYFLLLFPFRSHVRILFSIKVSKTL